MQRVIFNHYGRPANDAVFNCTYRFIVYVFGRGTKPQAEQTTTQHLLQQLWQAESIYRDDIIEDTVQRLYRIQPNHPEGLLAQMRLALRLERPDVA
ncbi:MAG TPA: hypothetical protein VK032_09960, partial [Burkholderiaceae bacterium]|nr:hypothetical protein [Burkholderiaceae bacterium]